MSKHSCFTAVLQEAGLVGLVAALRRELLRVEDLVSRPTLSTVDCETEGLALGGGGEGVTQFSSFERRVFFVTCK